MDGINHPQIVGLLFDFPDCFIYAFFGPLYLFLLFTMAAKKQMQMLPGSAQDIGWCAWNDGWIWLAYVSIKVTMTKKKKALNQVSELLYYPDMGVYMRFCTFF